VIDRSTFTATTSAGSIAGSVVGDGSPVLLLHGGPGLGYDYMLPLVAELETDFRVAIFQQRGLEPSTVEGPFTIARAIEDVVCVLDALGWSRAWMVGHSWGGHLALRFAAAHPARLLGILAVDPLGIVGDGGMAAFRAEMVARAPRAGRRRVRELEEVEKARELTTDERFETRRIMWPSYFADPENVPPMPPYVSSRDASKALTAELSDGVDEVAAALATGAVRYGILVGGASPFPWGQSARADADLSPSAFLKVVPEAGHFVWYEAPGAVHAALHRLTNSA
jgi:pimeloyl-ACP methyl ester carboxylesterase